MESIDRLEHVQNLLTNYGIPVGVAATSAGVLYFLKKFNILYHLLHKADANSKRHGGELVAQVLKAHNVKHVFTLVGGHISPILVACENNGIRVVDTRHEVTTVFAADAVARMTGTVGIAAVTAGPGVTNTVTAIKNAQMAESPVLLMGGAAASLLKGRGALQDIDQMSLFKPLCKYCVSVTTVRDIVPTLRKALQIAQSGTPGPVFVEFPIDVLYPYELIKKEIGLKETGKISLGQRVINWYLGNHLSNLFAGAWETHDVSPLPPSIPKASYSQIQKCVEMISRAKKPVILVGSQATLPPVPAEELRKTLEMLGIPCFLGGMSRGLLGRKSKIQARQRRRDALKDADLIILAGAVCDFRLSYGRVIPKKCKIVAINRDKKQLFKNADMFWKPTLPIQADVASCMVEVGKRLSGYQVDSDWVDLLQERDLEKEKANLAKCSEKTDVHLNPIKVIHKVEDIMSENSIIVADGGDFVGTAAYILRPRGPLCWLDPGAFGTLGVGGGFALGAKLCRPDSDVWIIYGDGTLGYSIMEYDTFTRHKTPILSIVGNDASWQQIAREQVPMFKSSVACDLAFSNYEKMVEGIGGTGFLLDRSNEDQMEEVLAKAVEEYRKGKSVLVNVMVGKTNFREGSISV